MCIRDRLVSHAANRFYLSGFELHDVQLNESAGRLVICADGGDWLCTDARYKDAAARLWDQDHILIYGPDAATEIGRLMRRCGSRLGLEAVSYTHLDVYKRQPKRNS